ncbi:hypothetical protein Ciccas_008317 [Cichlidogyrus casuarinus]|uniref:Uncharacterized protein n=1 Tax=Cichlidogyrus casuarinus TaxID=1844966 RepID=A0ABD2Q0M6_9PLAT
MERRLVEQERENSNRISKLQAAYSQELSSLMPAETQSHLQNTISSLRAQICILERRLDNQGQHVQHMDLIMLRKENFVDVSTQLTEAKNPFISVDSKVWFNSDQEEHFDPKLSTH